MTLEPNRLAFNQAPNTASILVLLPIGATVGYYGLPVSFQSERFVQFIPQLLAYVALGVWASRTTQVLACLGLDKTQIGSGLKWGILTGVALGSLNTYVILSVCPSLGYDITFLKQTPHGRLPVFVMVPWFICCIALFVEVNFRGFLLGRLAELESHWRGKTSTHCLMPFALLVSTLTFTFDPFMVNTFQYLHWIALWDGLAWGTIWLKTRNLWITVVAHTVEVIVMYSVVRMALG